MNWDQANCYAEQQYLGSHDYIARLVTINSIEEHNFLVNTFYPSTYLIGGKSTLPGMLIQLRLQKNKFNLVIGTWMWVEGGAENSTIYANGKCINFCQFSFVPSTEQGYVYSRGYLQLNFHNIYGKYIQYINYFNNRFLASINGHWISVNSIVAMAFMIEYEGIISINIQQIYDTNFIQNPYATVKKGIVVLTIAFSCERAPLADILLEFVICLKCAMGLLLIVQLVYPLFVSSFPNEYFPR